MTYDCTNLVFSASSPGIATVNVRFHEILEDGSTGFYHDSYLEITVTEAAPVPEPPVQEVEAPPKTESTVPKTGDKMRICIWSSLMLISTGTVIFIARKRISKQRDWILVDK